MEKLTVLLLEDNPLDAELALETLRDGGFACEVERVETREAFLAAVEACGFDLILADYSLPSFDGLTALEIAREKCPDIPFLFVSGAIGEELAIETLKSGATDYVLKQRLGRLAPSVRRALREAEDRRERRRAEKQLAEMLEREQAARKEAEVANRLKDEFLATVSHELRTPLNAMLGWARLLRDGKLDGATARRAVEIIERNALSQQKLIEDLLDVSRIVSGKLRTEAAPVNPAAVVEAAVDAVRPTAEAKGVRLEVAIEKQAGPVSGDHMRLQQVVLNLLSNAIKFTPQGGRVEVRLARVESHVELRVSDTGQGIEPRFLPHVFDPFWQEDGSSAKRHGGLGLGLAIVRHLVKMHGGSVTAESEGAGKGATFIVKLPLLAANTSAIKARGDLVAASLLTDVRILVVDDAADTREVLETMLAQHGALVKPAASAAEALEMVRQWRPDLLISDIGMPDEDGYALIRKVRHLGPEGGGNVPAIALTAFAQAQDRARALNAGFQLHVPKPVDMSELLAAVANVFARGFTAKLST
jgi:signal transduction histidine kinase